MLSEERPSKDIKFPSPRSGKEIAAKLWALSDEETAAAQVAAAKYVCEGMELDKHRLSLVLEGDLYKAEEERQLLATALRDPSKPDFPFATAAALRKFLTPDHRKFLITKLGQFMDERYPYRKVSDPEKIVSMVADLKAAGALSDYLSDCDGDTLISIAESLAAALPVPTTPSSSSTS
jgi:hypothetical protein